jgi:di/tricarboxylate transporter
MLFKARARSFVIIFSLLITLAFGTDSIQLAKDLWNDASLRAIAVQQATSITSQTPTTDITALVNQLGALSFKIGWWQTSAQSAPKNPLDWLSFSFFKLIGLFITAVAVSQGSSFWYDVLKKMTGANSSGGGGSSDGGNGPAG